MIWQNFWVHPNCHKHSFNLNQVVIQKAVMPGYDPASMNSELWIVDVETPHLIRGRNDSLFLNGSSLLSSFGVSIWIHVS